MSGKKTPEECSDRELLIRIDERTKHLPGLNAKVNKHEVWLYVMGVVVFILAAKTMPFIAEAIARAFEG